MKRWTRPSDWRTFAGAFRFSRIAEDENPWSQSPRSRTGWCAPQDLLPNSPELLGVGGGSTIVDLCGGFGRVARRLSPAAGVDGTVISIEKRRFVVERARRYALEGNFTNLQFRVGLADRLPLPDGVMDAAVNEWTRAIWELGLGPAMVSEMARVVRTGGRAAVTTASCNSIWPRCTSRGFSTPIFTTGCVTRPPPGADDRRRAGVGTDRTVAGRRSRQRLARGSSAATRRSTCIRFG